MTSVPVWVPVIGAVSTLVGLVLVALINRGKSRENQMIDQLQEDQKSMRGELTDVRRREIILRAYVFALWAHIADGKPPPPPALPKELFEHTQY